MAKVSDVDLGDIVLLKYTKTARETWENSHGYKLERKLGIRFVLVIKIFKRKTRCG